ncbi:MAG: DUF308 domain-containing protein [Oscillospiraceae bacterium]
MKSPEKIRSILERAPVPKAYERKSHHFSSVKAGRAFALLLMLAGVACLLFTTQIHAALPYILGVLLAVWGLGSIVRGIVTGEFRKEETKLTANGIVYLLLGAVILWNHANADEVIGSIWGLLGLIKGSEVLNAAICACAMKKPFIRGMLQAAIELVLGVLLLVDPTASVRHHVFLLGLELVLVGWQVTKETYRDSNKGTSGTGTEQKEPSEGC